ncbi:MAG: CRTAC1 family protein, partial [Colwellia sp.]|nr:CRTAC1 family protein [Colwellia sp.]
MKSSYKRGFTLFFIPLLITIIISIISQLMNADIPTINNQTPLHPKSNTRPSLSTAIPSITKVLTFKESAVTKGIIFKHEHRSSTLSGIADTYGSGVCTLDFNNDGFEDLFIVNGYGVTRRYGKSHWWHKKQGSRLYQNIEGLFFKDVSGKIYTDNRITTKYSGYGCAVGDLNNDGFADIVLGNTNYIELLINNAGSSFSQESIALKSNNSSTPENIWPMSLTLWDWNEDGYQDIFVANFTKFENDLKVGTKDYGYKSQALFESTNFSGQQNIILTRKVNTQQQNELEFDLSYLEKFDRTLTITPLQLLAPIQEEQHLNGLFIANATGSNSSVHSFFKNNDMTPSAFNSIIRKIKSPIVQTSQLTIQGEPAVIFTQHKKGGVQVYNSNKKEQEDLAWHVGLNSEKDNASQTWASLIADLNNDGLDDFVSARGFSSPHIDSLFKPQGSKNNIKLQSNTGKFSDNNTSLIPQLSRSSRGAAFADFNNDGLIDIVFNNNNGFFSLYMNDSPINNWISFSCEPLYLCRNSHWHIEDTQKKHLASKRFSRPEPFLSSNQKRVHFGLHKLSKPINLKVQLDDNTLLNFKHISLNKTYTVNIKSGKISPITDNIIRADQLPPFSNTFFAYLLNASLEELLATINQNINLNAEQLIQLSQHLISYKLNDKAISVTNSAEFLTLTSWLLNQALLDNASNSILLSNVIRLIGGSESSLYIDHLVDLIATLPEENFCQLTDELNYWFWEEEILPKSKQLLKSPLLHRTVNSKSTNIIICGLNALSATKDSTIGNSLIPLLHKNLSHTNELQRVQAATIRALGYLKHSTSKNKII